VVRAFGLYDVMTEKTKRILKLLLRLAVTVGLLWLILGRIDLGGLAEAIGAAQWRYVVLSWAIGIGAYWIRAVRLRFILEKQDCHVPTRTIFSASAVTTLYSLVLPGVISVGVKWYILRSFTGKAARVLSAMVYNQVSEILVRVLLSLIVFAVVSPVSGWSIPGICLAVAVVTIACSFLLLHPRTSRKLVVLSEFVLKPFPAVIRRGATKTIESSRTFASCGWPFHWKVAGFNVLSTLLSAVIYFCAARAAGISVPLTAFVWQASVVFVLAKLPISVANCGVREFTLIGFLSLYGVDATTAVFFSLLVFSNALVMAGIGLLYQLFGMSKSNRADSGK